MDTGCRVQGAGLTCILYPASSQLVKIEEKVFIYSVPISLQVIEMAELVIRIPEDLKLVVEQVSEIDWSLAVSRLVKEKFERLARLKRIVSKSELSEEKAVELSDKISESLARRYEEMLK